MRTMYDSTDINAIPADATMVAAYMDGAFMNEDAARARFPNATIVRITVFGAPDVHVIDCETRDATPQQAANWARQEANAGRSPTIYCNYSTWSQVQACDPPANVSYWVARYDNDPTIPIGAVAKQYSSDVQANLDTSSVLDFWPGVDTGDNDMTPQQAQQLANVEAMLNALIAPRNQQHTDPDPNHISLGDILTAVQAGPVPKT